MLNKNTEGQDKTSETTLKKYSFIALRFLFILVVVIGRSIVTYMFQIPNGFAPGGVSGIATIIYNILGYIPDHPKVLDTIFNPSIVIFALNIPLLILAFIYVNKKYTFMTLLSVFIYAGSLKIFEIAKVPQFTWNTGAVSEATDFSLFIQNVGIKMLAAIIGGVLDGACLGLLFKFNASAGGTEIVSMIIYKKKPTMNIAWILFIFDFSIAFCSGLIGITSVITSKSSMPATEIFVRVSAPIIFSCIALFLSSKVADYIFTGTDTSFVFNIVTSKPEEICEEIFEHLHRGATILDGEGAYSKDPKKIVVCIVSKKQTVELKKIARNLDENSFTYIMRASEVRGKGFEKIT